MFSIRKATSMDTRSLKISYETISRHRTRAKAEERIEELAKAEQKKRWPHRPEMVSVISTEYNIFPDGEDV